MILYIIFSICSQLSENKLIVIVPKVTMSTIEIHTAIKKHHFYRSFALLYRAIIYKCEDTSIQNYSDITLEDFYNMIQEKYIEVFSKYLSNFENKELGRQVEANEEMVKHKKSLQKSIKTFAWIYIDRFNDSFIAFKAKCEPEKVPITFDITLDVDRYIDEYLYFVPNNLFEQLEAEFRYKNYYRMSWNAFTDKLSKRAMYLDWYNQNNATDHVSLEHIPFDIEMEFIESINLFADITSFITSDCETSYSEFSGRYHIIVDMSVFIMNFFSDIEKIYDQAEDDLDKEISFTSKLLKILSVKSNALDRLALCENIKDNVKIWYYSQIEIMNLMYTLGVSDKYKLDCEKICTKIEGICARYIKLVRRKIIELAERKDVSKSTVNFEKKNGTFEAHFDSVTDSNENIPMTSSKILNVGINELLNDLVFFNEVANNKQKISLFCEFFFGVERSIVCDMIKINPAMLNKKRASIENIDITKNSADASSEPMNINTSLLDNFDVQVPEIELLSRGNTKKILVPRSTVFTDNPLTTEEKEINKSKMDNVLKSNSFCESDDNLVFRTINDANGYRKNIEDHNKDENDKDK